MLPLQPRLLLLWLLLLLQVSGGSCHTPTTTTTEKPNDFGVLEWIDNSDGGFVNPKQEFRYNNNNNDDDDDPTMKGLRSEPGMFATERIEANEILMKVPWNLFITASDVNNNNGLLPCGTVVALAKEMAIVKNEDDARSSSSSSSSSSSTSSSFFAPYARYLNAEADSQLPSDWSYAGKDLLQTLMGGTLKQPTLYPNEPAEWLHSEWYSGCLKGKPSTPLQDKAAMLVIQRCEDGFMVPGYDMYNHRNGKWLNADNKVVENQHFVVLATKTIEKGEQIHISENMCRECGGRKHGYGTAEIFRDYGFIEQFPQRWHYTDFVQFHFQFDSEQNEDGGLEYIPAEESNPIRLKNDEARDRSILWMRQQIRRLRKIKNSKYPTNNPATIHGIPQNEWDLIWQFYDANIVAMQIAITKLREERGDDDLHDCATVDYLPGGGCTNVTEDVGSHYDVLNLEKDDLAYRTPTCEKEDIFRFKGYHTIEHQKSSYQDLQFMSNPSEDNICLVLDNVIQICSNYRPQYHEFSVHAAARFVDSIKRVVFIGGGDSMLLHETLKYPDLELVVGLELDEVVTRQSFKYMQTPPHFDDERVEWWFGDATKSLLLLPKEYWQSFDLVLVDLSETVMSFTVTKELDVFEALALLLKPEGVMVKNELYNNQFNRVFDNTMHIHIDSPVICSQSLIMGSHSVDFLHAVPKDHGVETLLYQPQVTDKNKYDFLHDYRRNDPHVQGKCGPLPVPEEPSEQTSSVGVIEIVEAERVIVDLDNRLPDLLLEVIGEQGFNVEFHSSFDKSLILIVMKEGYVVARLWPEEKYCGFDINLWGGFDIMKPLRKALTRAVGSDLVSSYRIVVGGMYGSSTWREDQKLIGPQIVQTRNCQEKEATGGVASVDEIVKASLQETVNLVRHSFQKSGVVVAVLCGTSDVCGSAGFLEGHVHVDEVVKVRTCPNLEGMDASEQYANMIQCEILFRAELNQSLQQRKKADLFVIDSAVPYPMVQILNSVLDDDDSRTSWIKQKNVFVAVSVDPINEPWRSHFIDRYRKQYHHDPVARGEYFMEAGDTSVQVSVVTCGDDLLAYSLESTERRIRERFDSAGLGVSVELRTIHGGLFRYNNNFDAVATFAQSDYDDRPGVEQYNQQHPLGSQHIFQIVPKNGEKEDITNIELDRALEDALKIVGWEVSGHTDVSDIGDGVLISYVCDKGNAILVWDGRDHIDVNFFSFEEEKNLPERFVGSILGYISKDQKLQVGLRDDLPRGTGRVVNFKLDLK